MKKKTSIDKKRSIKSKVSNNGRKNRIMAALGLPKFNL